MDNLYLVTSDSGIPFGVFTWNKMLDIYPSSNWKKSNFKDNQWLTIDINGTLLKVIQIMINQDMPAE